MSGMGARKQGGASEAAPNKSKLVLVDITIQPADGLGPVVVSGYVEPRGGSDKNGRVYSMIKLVMDDQAVRIGDLVDGKFIPLHPDTTVAKLLNGEL